MMARLDYVWRLFATGLCLAVFCAGSLLFSLLVCPLVLCWPRTAARQRMVTAFIHQVFHALVALLQRLGVMTLETSGAAALREQRPAIVVANHPTWLDVVILLALVPSACCVVKNALWRNPCFWAIVRAAQYVSNARDPAALIDAASQQLACGCTVIVFPEGTRSPARDRLHTFSRGFAHMALKARVAILPVLIDCDPPVFTRARRWYHVPPRAFQMRVKVLEPVDARRLSGQDDAPALAARVVASAIETHMLHHLSDHGFFKTGTQAVPD
jgi:1-acyl-sn-glycerol-3-phosphate acyltransferase